MIDNYFVILGVTMRRGGNSWNNSATLSVVRVCLPPSLNACRADCLNSWRGPASVYAALSAAE